MDCSLQASLSMGFPEQEHWNGLPFPSPGDPPNPGIKPWYPALAGWFFTTEPPTKVAQGEAGLGHSRTKSSRMLKMRDVEIFVCQQRIIAADAIKEAEKTQGKV